MCNLKRNDTNELKTETHRLRQQTSGCQGQGGGEDDGGKG